MLFQSPVGESKSPKRSLRSRQYAGPEDGPPASGLGADTTQRGDASVSPETRGTATDIRATTAEEPTLNRT